MTRRLFSRAFRLFVASFAAVAAAATAQAQTVNTYSFTQTGYTINFDAQASGTGTLSGTFTGTLNTLGLWQTSDLSALSLTFSYPLTFGTVSANWGQLGNLSEFSFNTGSAGDLSLIANGSAIFSTACVGAPATLSLDCNPLGSNPANTFGAVLEQGVVIGQTTKTPVVTLVSSVTTVPAVPEPATWAMMLFGFGGIGFAMRRRSTSPPQFA